jgi:predicted dehydrogenase
MAPHLGVPTRWAIVGTGFVARQFARALPLARAARLAAVVSRSQASARAFVEAYGPSARAHDDLGTMLRDPEVDIVYLATPNHLHAAHGRAVLEAGKALLVEKPFATSAAEVREVIALARKKKVFCMEGMWMRTMPLVQRARALIREDVLGSVQTLTADFAYPTDLSGAHNRFLQPVAGGGALLDRGVYCLSLACFLLGQPTRILGTAALAPGGADERSELLVRFASGATAVLWSSLTTHGTNTATVMGTRATLRLHDPFYRPHRLTVTPAPAPFSPELSAPSAPGLSTRAKEHPVLQRVLRPVQSVLRRPEMDLHQPIAGTGFQFEADEASRCLRDGLLESPLVPLDETLRIMELMDEVRAQWRTPGDQEVSARPA